VAFATRKGRIQITHRKSFTCVDFWLAPAGWHDPSYRCLLPPFLSCCLSTRGPFLVGQNLNHPPRVRTISHPRVTIDSCSKKRLCLSNDTSISPREKNPLTWERHHPPFTKNASAVSIYCQKAICLRSNDRLSSETEPLFPIMNRCFPQLELLTPREAH
jgi:hypothetical protein